MEEEEAVQRPHTVRMAEHPGEESETPQPEMSADSHSTTEGDTGKMEVSDREESTGTTEPDLPHTGQGEARKKEAIKRQGAHKAHSETLRAQRRKY